MELINNRMYMSVKEAAAQTGATIPTVYGWLQRYELPRIRVVGNLMIAQDDLTHFIQNKPVVGRPKKRKIKEVTE